MAERDFDKEIDEFEEICSRVGQFLNNFKPYVAEMIDGLSRTEIAALTAGIHVRVDFELWAAYNRSKNKVNG